MGMVVKIVLFLKYMLLDDCPEFKKKISADYECHNWYFRLKITEWSTLGHF